SVKLYDPDGQEIDASHYTVDPKTATITFHNPIAYDSLTVTYSRYPEFITKTYSIYDKSRVLSNEEVKNLFQVKRDARKRFIPFEEFSTYESITHGDTIRNNQNAVVNSTLDLQVTRNLSHLVSLRASIQDTNISIPQGGHSQKLDEYDQI